VFAGVILTDSGIPLSVKITPANTHEIKAVTKILSIIQY